MELECDVCHTTTDTSWSQFPYPNRESEDMRTLCSDCSIKAEREFIERHERVTLD